MSRVPTSSGSCVRTKIPNSEMFVMFAYKKVSCDSQSTDQVTSMRSEPRRSDTGGRSDGLGCSSLTVPL